jgi:Ca2+-binding RTX toxin-like protein
MKENTMSNYTFGSPPFTTTTFTSPIANSNDVISANFLANFTINGNGGNDKITTGGGNDTITTGTGNDTIAAGNGNNTVSAGNGTNTITSGSGNDTITTGTGNDTITAGDGHNTVTAGDGNNTVTSGSGNDTITTGSGADIVKSGGGDDIIRTGSGNDIIESGSGNDSINAGAGNDLITSGAGIDALTGGGGHDTFVYGSLSEALLGADTIFDFNTSSPSGAGEGDLLNLSKLVDNFSGLPNHFSLESLVSNGYLHFSGNTTTTVISIDSNGSAIGGSSATLLTLVGVPFTTEGAAVHAFADNILV